MAMVVVCLWWMFILLLVSTATAAPVALTEEEQDLMLLANEELEKDHPRQVIEGDILINEYVIRLMGLLDDQDQVQDQLLPDENRKKKASISEVLRRKLSWPGCVVPYAFSSYVGEKARLAVHAAMEHWMENTCVQFIPRTNETDYILFIEDYGCWSDVGRVGGEQLVSLGDDRDSNEYCKKMGVIVHELGHALGFFHEQSRPDRDNYVDILEDNIKQGKEDNFLKYSELHVDSMGVKYDLGSIMHYGKFVFSKNGKPTIIPKERGREIGQREGLSPLDIKQAQLMCKCARQPFTLRPAIKSEPLLSVQSTNNGLCLHSQPSSSIANSLVLDSCHHNSSSQMWQWNGNNQLYNPTTLECISTNPEGLLELRNCTADDMSQQWLCADHFIKQPTTGNCITVGEDSYHLVAERCSLVNNKQGWNKYTGSMESEMEESLLRILGDTNVNETTAETICTIPGYHTVAECYSERIYPGWSLCRRQGYYVTGLYHISNKFFQRITDFHCCFTPHVFTGEPETLSTIEDEICKDVTWWSSLNRIGWFKCPTGLYFKGYLKVYRDGLDSVQQVKCCKTDKAPQVYRQCYTDTNGNSEGLHKCRHVGYHITGIYKTDCNHLQCIEKILCCI